jgi:DNA repair protein RadC/uncharacterized small protein (DUF1192 family)
MNTRLFYAFPSDEYFQKGSQLFSEHLKGSLPILPASYEAEAINDTWYLLIDRPVEEYLGCTPQRSGGYLYHFKSVAGNLIARSDDGRTLHYSNWIKPGAISTAGKIIEVGESIVVVESPIGKRSTIAKSTLSPYVDPNIEANKVLKAFQYSLELKKSLAAAPAAPSPSSTPSPSPKPELTGIKWNFGKPKGGDTIPAEKVAQEGETKQFGPFDIRKLVSTAKGKLRWMNADEERKAMQEKNKQIPVNTPDNKNGGVVRTFRTGEKIPFNGNEVEVVSHAENIVAFKKDDGSTGTFKANEYDETKHSTETKPHSDETKRRNSETKYEDVAAAHKQDVDEQARLKHRPSGKADWETEMREKNRITEEARQNPEYQKFKKETENDGYTSIGGDFLFRKIAILQPENQRLELEKLWIPEEMRASFSINGRSMKVVHNGEEHYVTDATGANLDNLTISHVVTKETKQLSRFDLDQYRGTIELDSQGNAFVKRGEAIEGKFNPAEGVTQDDLMRPGIIRIINDEVWKRTVAAEGTLFEDVRLGRIERGITFYQHGDEQGVVDGDRRTYVTKKKRTRKPVQTSELNGNEKDLQREIERLQSELKSKADGRRDVEIAKSRLPQLQTEKKSGAPIDAFDYQNLFNTYLKQAGKGVDEQIADSYGKPEWAATIRNLAEQMRVADTERAAEINSFNSMSVSGVLKQVPDIHPTENYLNTAEDLLRDHRNTFLREKKRERIAALRSGESKTKFEWGETSELPENAKAIQTEPFKIRDSKGTTYHVVYAIVPMTDVVQSHEATGEVNVDHPVELQARKRGDPHSVMQMKKISENINDDVVSDNADATRGAPVAYAKGNKVFIVQGNGRAAGIKGTVDAQRQKYYGMIVDKARQLGLPTDKITDSDMLVRVMTPRHTYEDARRLGAFGQESAALPYTEVESARAYQNAQRMPFDYGVNLKGIGNKPLDENNIGTFIQNNPELYKRITEDSGYTREAIESHPAIQAKLINTAILSQLRPGFIDDIASRDERTHLILKRIAPSLIDNQKMVAEGKLPAEVDMQNFLHRVIKHYDNIDSGTKALMTMKKGGEIAFLNEDPHELNTNTLLHRMRQEDLLSTDKKEENTFRDPLHVVGLLAYHQAMNARSEGASQQRAATQFALNVRRFSDALKEYTKSGDDMFGETKSAEEKKAEQYDRLIHIAEKVFLQNRPYTAEEGLSADEMAAAAETYGSFGVHKKMRAIAGTYGFNLPNDQPLKKSAFSWFVGLFQKSQLKLPIDTGESREFGPGDRRRLIEMPTGVRRWVNDDEYEKIQQMKLKAQRPKQSRGKYIESRSHVLSWDKQGNRHWKPRGEHTPTLFHEQHTADKAHIADYRKQESIANELPPSMRKKIVEFVGKDSMTRFGRVKTLSDRDLIVVATETGFASKTPLNEMHRAALDELVQQGKITQAEADKAFSERGEVNAAFIEDFKKRGKVAKKSVFGMIFDLVKNAQFDLFSSGKTKSPVAGIGGIGWKKSGGEKPGHKYLRRYKGKSGGWEYVYKNAIGEEYAADKEGNPLPRHRDWKAGDQVHFGNIDATIEKVGKTVITVRTEDGRSFNAKLPMIETTDERQHRLRGEKENLPNHWQSIVDELEDDLAAGESSGKYEYGADRAEVGRKLAEAKDQLKGHAVKTSDLTTTKEKKGEREINPEEIFGAKAETLHVPDAENSRSYVEIEYKKKGYLKIAGTKIRSAADVAFICRQTGDGSVERLLVIPVDKDGKPLTIECVTIGILDSSYTHPRETLSSAIELGAHGVYLVHNHPSGNNSPSPEDVEVTKNLEEAGKLANINILGHVVITKDRYSVIHNGEVNIDLKIPERKSKGSTIPIYSRIGKARASTPDVAIFSPEDVVMQMRQMDLSKEGISVVTLSTSHRINGIHHLSHSSENPDASFFKNVFTKVVKNNAAAFVLYIKSKGTDEEALRTIVAKLGSVIGPTMKPTGIPVFDVIADSGKKYYVSAAETGFLKSIARLFMFRKRIPDAAPIEQSSQIAGVKNISFKV